MKQDSSVYSNINGYSASDEDSAASNQSRPGSPMGLAKRLCEALENENGTVSPPAANDHVRFVLLRWLQPKRSSKVKFIKKRLIYF